jgi:hypothetical protein
MVFASQTLVEMLRLYSSIIGNSTPECEAALFENLKQEANAIEPDTITSDSMTAYEAFLMVEKLLCGNVTVLHLDVAGYDDTTMELSKWDPLNPIDDTNQMPSGNCVTSWREIRGGNVNPIVCGNMVDDAVMKEFLEASDSLDDE